MYMLSKWIDLPEYLLFEIVRQVSLPDDDSNVIWFQDVKYFDQFYGETLSSCKTPTGIARDAISPCL